MSKENNEVKKALDVIKAAMKNDPGYAWGWHCSIAVAQQDAGVDHTISNEGAARFMQMAFGVDTSKGP